MSALLRLPENNGTTFGPSKILSALEAYQYELMVGDSSKEAEDLRSARRHKPWTFLDFMDFAERYADYIASVGKREIRDYEGLLMATKASMAVCSSLNEYRVASAIAAENSCYADIVKRMEDENCGETDASIAIKELLVDIESARGHTRLYDVVPLADEALAISNYRSPGKS